MGFPSLQSSAVAAKPHAGKPILEHTLAANAQQLHPTNSISYTTCLHLFSLKSPLTFSPVMKDMASTT